MRLYVRLGAAPARLTPEAAGPIIETNGGGCGFGPPARSAIGKLLEGYRLLTKFDVPHARHMKKNTCPTGTVNSL